MHYRAMSFLVRHLRNLNFLLELIDIGGSKNLTLRKQLHKFNSKGFRMLVLEDSQELAMPSLGIPLLSIEYTIFSYIPCPNLIPKSHTHSLNGLHFMHCWTSSLFPDSPVFMSLPTIMRWFFLFPDTALFYPLLPDGWEICD